jgi:hypothetical protein
VGWFKQAFEFLFGKIEDPGWSNQPPPPPTLDQSGQSGPGGEKVALVRLKTTKTRGVETQTAKIVISFQSPLRHQSTYRYPGTEMGKQFGKCKLCQDERVSLFSDALDANDKKVRICFECLEKYGSPEQLEVAASRSKIARRYLECREALRKLKRMFPDPNFRPYGDRALEMELESPGYGFEGIERILTKVETEVWTRTDELAMKEGRAAVDAKYADRNR